MLLEKHNKRQKMHEELLVSLIVEECGIGLFFLKMIGSSQLAQDVWQFVINFEFSLCIFLVSYCKFEYKGNNQTRQLLS